MRGHEADTLQSLDLLNLLQKLCKSNRLIQILSIGIHVLSQKHNFHNTICHKVLNLTDDLPWLSASLPSSYIWNDAVTAEIVTAKHDIDTALKTEFTLIWQLFHDLVCIFPYIHDHLFILYGLHQKFRKFENVMCTKNQVYKTVALFDLFYYFFFLHHTSAECDHHMRIFLLIPMQVAKTPVHFIVCIFTDSTCIVNNKICILRFRLLIANGIQDTT